MYNSRFENPDGEQYGSGRLMTDPGPREPSLFDVAAATCARERGVAAIRAARGDYNRACVRAWLLQRQPRFAAALEAVVRKLT